MRKRLPALFFTVLLACLLLAGCTSPLPVETPAGTESPDGTASSWAESIPFEEGQLYAAAYLGYQEPEALEEYAQRYLDGAELPVHYLSAGDYYLIIPRCPGTELSLYRNDLETAQSTLIFHDPDCGPFVLQCNASDIFADATIRLTCQDGTAEFSPFISLKDGSVQLGERGLDLASLPE